MTKIGTFTIEPKNVLSNTLPFGSNRNIPVDPSVQYTTLCIYRPQLVFLYQLRFVTKRKLNYGNIFRAVAIN